MPVQYCRLHEKANHVIVFVMQENWMCKWVKKLAPVQPCNLFTPITLSFDLRDGDATHQNQELTTWGVASVTAELLYWAIFPRNVVLQNLDPDIFKKNKNKRFSTSDSHAANK